MDADNDLLRRVCETVEGYLALGNEMIDLPQVRFLRSRGAPRIYDANRGVRVRAASRTAVDAVIARADDLFNGLHHRAFSCDPLTPAPFEARLLQEGYRAEADLQMVLEGEILATAPEIELRAAESDADWSAIARLTRMDHEEMAKRFGHPVYAEEVTVQMVATRRAKRPALRHWVARIQGADCAFFSSWPGLNGIGKVEDLFTHPDFRGRGIATALIVQAVGDARARGAGPVVIAARPDDTPRRMYERMGFRPICVTRSYVQVLNGR
jgi:GNAT superfamily N-acetyltransferase